jgi:Neuraminidase (sialidase)
VWYSDDGGETYILSETVLEKMDEAQLVELSDGRVMPNMRNDHLTSCDCRAVAISTDGGKTFGDISYDPALISPVCMASIIRMSNGSLIFANPASKKDRVNGMLKRSDDGGVSWVRSWQVTDVEEDYAYSCLTHVARSDQVGLLWETTSLDCSGPSCQLVFSKITVL